MPPALALAAAGFCTGASWQVVAPILPLRLARLGYGPAEIGLLIGLMSLAMALVELQAGVINAAIGRHRSLLGGYTVNALFIGLTAIAARCFAGNRAQTTPMQLARRSLDVIRELRAREAIR